jgi:hypothetical protein
MDSIDHGARIVAAFAGGPAPHRLLSGDGPQGPWCGAGDARPVLAATAARVAVGAGAAAFDGHSGSEQPAAESVELPPPGDGGLAAALHEARARLEGLPGAAEARSTLVAIVIPGEPIATWLGLGPPVSTVLARCWPGIIQGPDASGVEGAAAPLALAAEAAAAAVAEGRVAPDELASALDRARALAVEEGILAERHARLMDAAGDDRGAAVRRLVAQAYAVDAALTALREVPAAGPA